MKLGVVVAVALALAAAAAAAAIASNNKLVIAGERGRACEDVRAQMMDESLVDVDCLAFADWQRELLSGNDHVDVFLLNERWLSRAVKDGLVLDVSSISTDPADLISSSQHFGEAAAMSGRFGVPLSGDAFALLYNPDLLLAASQHVVGNVNFADKVAEDVYAALVNIFGDYAFLLPRLDASSPRSFFGFLPVGTQAPESLIQLYAQAVYLQKAKLAPFGVGMTWCFDSGECQEGNVMAAAAISRAFGMSFSNRQDWKDANMVISLKFLQLLFETFTANGNEVASSSLCTLQSAFLITRLSSTSTFEHSCQAHFIVTEIPKAYPGLVHDGTVDPMVVGAAVSAKSAHREAAFALVEKLASFREQLHAFLPSRMSALQQQHLSQSSRPSHVEKQARELYAKASRRAVASIVEEQLSPHEVAVSLAHGITQVLKGSLSAEQLHEDFVELHHLTRALAEDDVDASSEQSLLAKFTSYGMSGIFVTFFVIGCFWWRARKDRELMALERYNHWQIDYDDLEDIEFIEDNQETMLATYDHRKCFAYRLNVNELQPKASLSGTTLRHGSNGSSQTIQPARRRSNWLGLSKSAMALGEDGAVAQTNFREMAESFMRLKDLRHPNIVEFFGVSSSPVYMVVEYCAKGSLYDVLRLKSQIKLDLDFKVCMAMDAARGMMFLHNNQIAHRNLRSTKILVDHRFVCKISCVHLDNMNQAGPDPDDLDTLYWIAPELFRMKPFPRAESKTLRTPGTPVSVTSTGNGYTTGSKEIDWFKADVYSFAIILWEMLTGEEKEPYGDDLDQDTMTLKLLISSETDPLRPLVPLTQDDREQKFIACMEQCWNPNPINRPSFSNVLSMLQSLTGKESSSILEKMAFMLEKWSESLEDVVEQRTQELAEEKKRAEALLHNILPKSVAEQLQHTQFIAEMHPEATVFFSDICGFTAMSHGTPPKEVVLMLNGLFTVMDSLADKYGLEKIKTIGDAYMAACGCPQATPDHVERVANFALEALQVKLPGVAGKPLQMRMGIHTGPVIAGVVGTRKFAYDLWGDTVNTASRMESNGVPGRVCVSQQVMEILKDKFEFEQQPAKEIKGLGLTITYLIVPPKSKDIPPQLSGSSKWALLQSNDNKRRLMVLGQSSAGSQPSVPSVSTGGTTTENKITAVRSHSNVSFSDQSQLNRTQAVRDKLNSSPEAVRPSFAHGRPVHRNATTAPGTTSFNHRTRASMRLQRNRQSHGKDKSNPEDRPRGQEMAQSSPVLNDPEETHQGSLYDVVINLVEKNRRERNENSMSRDSPVLANGNVNNSGNSGSGSQNQLESPVSPKKYSVGSNPETIEELLASRRQSETVDAGAPGSPSYRESSMSIYLPHAHSPVARSTEVLSTSTGLYGANTAPATVQTSPDHSNSAVSPHLNTSGNNVSIIEENEEHSLSQSSLAQAKLDPIGVFKLIPTHSHSSTEFESEL